MQHYYTFHKITMLYLAITYNIETDLYSFKSNIKPECQAEVLGDFLRIQIGNGKDETPPVESTEYHIRLALDLADDTFSVTHDCGNLALRDGIMLNALHQLQKN